MSEHETEFPEVEFVPFGNNPEEREANLELVEPSPGFPTTCILLGDAILRRADTVVLDYSAHSVAVRFQIDGMWHPMPPMDRETGDYMLAAMKQLAGMNYAERRMRQEGAFEAKLDGKKVKCKVVSQGVATGERVAIFTNRKKPPCETVEDLGIRDSMRKQITDVFKAESGLIVSCGMPGEGLTTSWRATLSAFDRFMRDFYVIEEKSTVEPEVINIGSITYDASAGEDFWTPIPQLMLREPNVLCFPEITSGEMLNRLMELAEKNNILLVVRVPAKHTLDALLRLMALNPDVDKMLGMMRAIICMRSIRKLCENCKQAFHPNPQLLTQLGIPPGRIQYLHRHLQWHPDMLDEEGVPVPPCEECQGIGFMEQAGLFEFLEMNDTISNAVRQSPRLDTLAATAKHAGHITIRDEGIVLVAKGDTSIEELQRVLKK